MFVIGNYEYKLTFSEIFTITTKTTGTTNNSELICYDCLVLKMASLLTEILPL